MAAVKFTKCTLCHIFATSYDINMSEEYFLYILIYEESVIAKNGGGPHTILYNECTIPNYFLHFLLNLVAAP